MVPPVLRVCLPNFNPPSLCGEGPLLVDRLVEHAVISIRPPRGGRDTHNANQEAVFRISIHPPRGGRDEEVITNQCISTISIHPPRKGRDLSAITVPTSLAHFNPPSPQGEGQDRPEVFSSVGRISIHPPRKGRDGLQESPEARRTHISIHPPRVGRDPARAPVVSRRSNFNPPSPQGEGPKA